MTDAVVILQARMASRRLPGKALMRIGVRSILAHCLHRLRAGSAPVLLATTRNAEDDALESEAASLGVPVFRGSANDVLRRFVDAARWTGARRIVRATADNPAVDIDAPSRVLSLMDGSGADYVSERGLPYGAAVEAVSVEALERADRAATTPEDREHVTTFVRRHPARFALVEGDAPPELTRPHLRVTIDTADDLRFMRGLSKTLGHPEREPSLLEYIRAADRTARVAVSA